ASGGSAGGASGGSAGGASGGSAGGASGGSAGGASGGSAGGASGGSAGGASGGSAGGASGGSAGGASGGSAGGASGGSAGGTSGGSAGGAALSCSGRFPFDGGCLSATSVVAGPGLSCAIDERRQLWCWGASNRDEFFVDAGPESFAPIFTNVTNVRGVSIALDSVCALFTDAGVGCSGTLRGSSLPVNRGRSFDCVIANAALHFGLETSGGNNRTYRLPLDGGAVAGSEFSLRSSASYDPLCRPMLSASHDEACGVYLGSSSVVCLNYNSGSNFNITTLGLSTSGVTVNEVAVGQDVICATTGTQAGCRTTRPAFVFGQSLPTGGVIAIDAGVTRLELGNDFGCAQFDGGAVACWEPDAGWTNFPTLTGATSLSVGSDHACAIVAGEVQCFWSNSRGKSGAPPTAGPFLRTPRPIGP
ncbi:MAG: hypothetical protein Q8L14_38585, partial [Myxococcales bacterium]|nr:hypothetical protein [Myxococcales bacterium]